MAGLRWARSPIRVRTLSYPYEHALLSVWARMAGRTNSGDASGVCPSVQCGRVRVRVRVRVALLYVSRIVLCV